MPILTVSDIKKVYGDQEILNGITFSLEPKEKVALIGRNGTGKTTLLRLAAGLEEPDRGSITLAGWARVAYLAQVPEGPSETDVVTHVLSGAADVQTLEERACELEGLMASPQVHDDLARMEAIMEEYAHVRDRFEHAGGFTLASRARMVLAGLGFSEADQARPLGALSGGWRVRAELARVLLAEPDLLLLDEPTNHLDVSATEWLEAYLKSFPGATIVVSHDRALIDAVTSKTLELEDGRLTSYPGAYSVYVMLKTQQVRRQQELYQRQQEEIAKLEAYIHRYKAGNRATQAKSREKMLARIQASKVEAPRLHTVIRPRAQAVPLSGKVMARLHRVGKRYGDVEVFSGVSLEIYRGERIGLRGFNGAGKSTLMKLIAGVEPPSTGHLTLGTGVRARYFSQESTDDLDPNRTGLDEILAGRSMTPEQARTYLGRFLFSGEEVFKRVAMLSGGERQRLNLARLLLGKTNLLLLDEPTNHLDIPSREALETALQDFPGTVMVATHDRYLMERLATRILTVQDRTVRDFHGTYREWRERSTKEAAQRAVPSRTRLRAKEPMLSRAAFGPRPSSRPPRPAGLTFDEVAEQIAAVERELEEVGARLSDPELYRDAEHVKSMRVRYEKTEQRLAELYRTLAMIDYGSSET